MQRKAQEQSSVTLAGQERQALMAWEVEMQQILAMEKGDLEKIKRLNRTEEEGDFWDFQATVQPYFCAASQRNACAVWWKAEIQEFSVSSPCFMKGLPYL